MRKLGIVSFAIIMVLMMSCVAFAKNTVDLGLTFSLTENNLSSSLSINPAIMLKGHFDINETFAISGSLFFDYEKVTSASYADSNYFDYSAYIYAEYTAIDLDFIQLGLKGGFRYLGRNYSIDGTNPHVEKLSDVTLMIGAFYGITISPKLSMYGDVRVPIAAYSKEYNDTSVTANKKDYSGFIFSLSSIWLSSGIRYNITPAIHIGFETGNTITTSTSISSLRLFTSLRLLFGFSF